MHGTLGRGDACARTPRTGLYRHLGERFVETYHRKRRSRWGKRLRPRKLRLRRRGKSHRRASLGRARGNGPMYHRRIVVSANLAKKPLLINRKT